MGAISVLEDREDSLHLLSEVCGSEPLPSFFLSPIALISISRLDGSAKADTASAVERTAMRRMTRELDCICDEETRTRIRHVQREDAIGRTRTTRSFEQAS